MTALIVAIVAGVVASLLAGDLLRNIDSMCYWIIRRAVRLAPAQKRARIDEELRFDVHETSGVFPKLFVTSGVFVSVFKARQSSGLLSDTSTADEPPASGGHVQKTEEVLISEDIVAVLENGEAARDANAKEDAPARVLTGVLTNRQVDCLTWTAHGKTAWETAEILGLTESTVNTHLNEAARNLGVHGKHHAVVKALSQGQLDAFRLKKERHRLH